MSGTKLPWTPWKDVVALRADVRSGELSLAEFAADLHDAKLGRGRKVYWDPADFFALTYPTANLRALAKDVVLRLAGKNTKAVRQLELTYGGGKTHTLITLLHLVADPERLPDVASVREFKADIGMPLPRARVAVLAFDKLDLEKGMEVADPRGRVRWLRQPWSVLAWQLAGGEGLAILHADNREEERATPPAENLLEALLRQPQREGLATLVLMDEVLMYARVKVTSDPGGLDQLEHFFQGLCQAVVKVERAAMVASILATDPSRNDEQGKRVLRAISDILAREKDEGVQPVLKEDVAEVLRRRFFTAKSLENPGAFRQHVIAAVQGICDLDEASAKNRKAVEERFLRSYPFHPDLTEVFYGKWTHIDGFQKTRGVLRFFALALRDAEPWDVSPLVGTNVFLPAPGRGGVSEAARELTTVASKAQTEGSGQQNWTAILEKELEKGVEVQAEHPALRHRELEQAVFATFLHSQPADRHALLPELRVLVGPTRPDAISLEKGLRLWLDRSWFLDESADTAPRAASGGPRPLPQTWRLGSKPNLTQMHHEALQRVSTERIETRLLEEIRKAKSLTVGAAAAGARVHNLPLVPREIEDDELFHYVVLGPDAASESGKPSVEARRFLEEKTGPDHKRTERNSVVLVVPSKDGLDALRLAVRDSLGWDEVRDALKGQNLGAVRSGLLDDHSAEAARRVPLAVAQAYCIVVTISEDDEVQAFKLQVGDRPLFQAVKEDPRTRVQDAPISADAILPGGPYDLWREGEESRRVKDVVGAFARLPRLPKMLDRRAIRETILAGCRDGVFVARVTRADRSVRSFWRTAPDDATFGDPTMELVLPGRATLTELSSTLVLPSALPELWGGGLITVQDLRAQFAGDRTIAVDRAGFVEHLQIPRAPSAVVDAAIAAAVKEGRLWLTVGPASLLEEEVPAGLLVDTAALRLPPKAIGPTELVPERLPSAWAGGATTALVLLTALSQREGTNLPWSTVRDAIDGAIRARVLERSPTSGPWPTPFSGAGSVHLRLPALGGAAVPPTSPVQPNARVAEAVLTTGQVQDLAEAMSALVSAKGDCELVVRVRIELSSAGLPPDAALVAVNKVLADVRPDWKLR